MPDINPQLDDDLRAAYREVVGVRHRPTGEELLLIQAIRLLRAQRGETQAAESGSEIVVSPEGEAAVNDSGSAVVLPPDAVRALVDLMTSPDVEATQAMKDVTAEMNKWLERYLTALPAENPPTNPPTN